MDLEELRKIYDNNFSLRFLGYNITNKFALISLICFLVYKLRGKAPNLTHYDLILKLSKDLQNQIPESILKGLAIICEDFSYGCTEFLTFDIPIKEIPNKIKELLENQLPF